MLVATLIAAAVVGQVCPRPTSPNGPPPCAAANVPGCLPGYHREVDAYGHARYVCGDVAYDAPVASPAPAPPPPSVPPPPPPSARPPPRYARSWAEPAQPGRGILGLVLMPGVVSSPYYAYDSTGAGSVALELRPEWGGLRLRLGFDGSSYTRAAEVALKYDFFDWSPIRPFVALGVGAGAVDPDPDWRMTASVAAGVDLYVTRDLFLTFEVKERAFAERASSAYYGLDTGPLQQTAFFMGVGLYL